MRLFRKAERGALVRGVCRLCAVEGSDSLPSRDKVVFVSELVQRCRVLSQSPLVVDPKTGKVNWLRDGWFKLLPEHPGSAPKGKVTRHLEVQCKLDNKVRLCSDSRTVRCVRGEQAHYMELFTSAPLWRMLDCSLRGLCYMGS